MALCHISSGRNVYWQTCRVVAVSTGRGVGWKYRKMLRVGELYQHISYHYSLVTEGNNSFTKHIGWEIRIFSPSLKSG